MNHLVQTLKWVLVIRGILAILFGLLAIFLPSLTVKALIIFFGVVILADGVVNLLGGVQSRKDLPDWWVYVLEGVFSMLLGAITIFWPNVSGVALLIIIATWAIVSGVGKIVAAIGMRKLIEGEMILLLTGIISVVFGFVMLFFPQFTIRLYIGVIGFFSLLLGIFMFVLAARIQEEHVNPKIKSLSEKDGVADDDSEIFDEEEVVVVDSIKKSPVKKDKSGGKTKTAKKKSSSKEAESTVTKKK